MLGAGGREEHRAQAREQWLGQAFKRIARGDIQAVRQVALGHQVDILIPAGIARLAQIEQRLLRIAAVAIPLARLVHFLESAILVANLPLSDELHSPSWPIDRQYAV